MKLYEDALANKRVEAQNALIFAGRIAVLEGRPVSAVSSFKKATRLKDDPDARLLIGKQLAVASDFGVALGEYRTALMCLLLFAAVNMQQKALEYLIDLKTAELRALANLLVQPPDTVRALSQMRPDFWVEQLCMLSRISEYAGGLAERYAAQVNAAGVSQRKRSSKKP